MTECQIYDPFETDFAVLQKKIRGLTKRLRKQYPWPDARYTSEGYFNIPISVDGQYHQMPLGFIGTKGCRWAKVGGCTMCDYGGFEGNIPDRTLVEQAASLLDLWENETEINLSSLGSFFDDKELRPAARQSILEAVSKRKQIKLIGVESRAADITPEKIKSAKQILGRCELEIGMGLESRNDFVRNVCINKGLSLFSFEKALEAITASGASAVAHVLFKPPFLTELEAIEDTIETVEYLNQENIKRIVIMVCNVKKGTLVYELFKKGLYRAPWLWSVLQAVLALPRKAQKKILIYGFKCGLPMEAVGKNCPDCTRKIMAFIDRFCGTGDINILKQAMNLSCGCKKLWQASLDQKPVLPLEKRVWQHIQVIEETKI